MGFGASLSVLAIFKVLNEAFIFSVKSRRVCLSGVTISGWSWGVQGKNRVNFPDLNGVWCVMDGLKIDGLTENS